MEKIFEMKIKFAVYKGIKFPGKSVWLCWWVDNIMCVCGVCIWWGEFSDKWCLGEEKTTDINNKHQQTNKHTKSKRVRD